jgi:hypothetical protein
MTRSNIEIEPDDETARIRKLITDALCDQADHERYARSGYRPLHACDPASVIAFKTVFRAFGKRFGETLQNDGRVFAEFADLHALLRVLLLDRRFSEFLGRDPEIIRGRISILRYVRAPIAQAPDMVLIAFETHSEAWLRQRRNGIEDARQATSLHEPWSPEDVRAWTADEKTYAGYLAKLKRQARLLPPARAKTADAAGAQDPETPSEANAAEQVDANPAKKGTGSAERADPRSAEVPPRPPSAFGTAIPKGRPKTPGRGRPKRYG